MPYGSAAVHRTAGSGAAHGAHLLRSSRGASRRRDHRCAHRAAIHRPWRRWWPANCKRYGVVVSTRYEYASTRSRSRQKRPGPVPPLPRLERAPAAFGRCLGLRSMLAQFPARLDPTLQERSRRHHHPPRLSELRGALRRATGDLRCCCLSLAAAPRIARSVLPSKHDQPSAAL